MGKNDNLHQLAGVGFVVEKFPQDFQAETRQVLTFVDDENNGLVLLDALLKQRLLDFFFDLGAFQGGVRRAWGEHLSERFQKIFPGGKVGIRNQMCFHARIVSQLPDQLTAQGGLPRAHLPDNDVETPAQAQGQFDFLQATPVPAGREKQTRVR